MKKLILFAAILFAGVSVANAQTKESGEVTLNVNLTGIQTITVLTGQTTIDLDYLEEKNYTDGVTSTNANHLKVSSTGGFNVTVSATGNKLTRTGTGGGDIDGSTITITPSKGTDNDLGSVVYLPATLAQPEVKIINSGVGGFGQNFNVEYKGGKDYIDKYVAGDSKSIYTTTVTYTLTAI